jgi:hypothetical protein
VFGPDILKMGVATGEYVKDGFDNRRVYCRSRARLVNFFTFITRDQLCHVTKPVSRVKLSFLRLSRDLNF